MKQSEIPAIRLASQRLLSHKEVAIAEVVGAMGAMQAQDYAMMKFAVGVRLKGITEKDVEAALDQGRVLRTHLLRPTWHLVTADDIYWMLELTSPQINASLRSRHAELELSGSALKRIYTTIEKALAGQNHLTKEEISAIFEKAKIPVGDNRVYHILMKAELEGLICSGRARGNKPSYALLHERVPKHKGITREEALEKLARKYFSSRGPATIHDFAWWSGLSLGDVRKAVAMIDHDFISEKIGAATYWFDSSCSKRTGEEKQALLLPAFDEFLISYKDRKAAISKEHQQTAIYTNGIFRPVIVINGTVAGIWKRTIKKEKVLVEADLFRPLNKIQSAMIERSVQAYGCFLNKQAALRYTNHGSIQAIADSNVF